MDTGSDPRKSDRIVNPDELNDDVEGHVASAHPDNVASVASVASVNPDADDVSGHVASVASVNPDTSSIRVNPDDKL